MDGAAVELRGGVGLDDRHVASGYAVVAPLQERFDLIAKMSATIDEVSGGRFALGLGAGWNETEYRAFGPAYDHRVSRFEESFAIIRRLVAGERGRTYVGPHHVGFLVDDLDEGRRRGEQHGATFFMGAPGVKGTTHFEEKYCDPDGLIFDISGHGWAGTAEWSKP